MSQRATTPRKDARWANGSRDSRRQNGRWPWSRRLAVALLLMGLLLASLAATGWHHRKENDRQRHATDEHSAELTAAWIARALNTVAVNNRAMAQMIVQISVRDSLPLATTDSLTDQKMLAQRLASWRQQAAMLPWTASAFQAMADQVDSEIAWLNSLENSLGSPPLPLPHSATGKPVAGPQTDSLWQAMRLIQQQSLASLESLPWLAIDASPDNAWPDSSCLRWETKPFDDFRVAVMQEPILVPQTKPDSEYARPWRRTIRRDRLSSSPQDGAGSLRSHPNDSNDSLFLLPAMIVSRDSGTLKGRCPLSMPLPSFALEATSPAGSSVPAGYESEEPCTQKQSDGIASLIFDRLNEQMADRLPLSRFSRHLPSQAIAKLRMLWPDASAPAESLSPAISPNWVTSMSEARRRAAEGQVAVETLFVAVEVRSRWPLSHSHLGEPGSWADAQPADGSIRLIRLPGWVDPANWPKDLLQVADGQWRDLWSYQVRYDPALGLSTDDASSSQRPPTIHTVHRIDDFFFIAVDFGQPRSVTNPYDRAELRQLPGPIHWLGPDRLTIASDSTTTEVFRSSCSNSHQVVWSVHSTTEASKRSAAAKESSSP